jgi:hypothetical protein
LEISIPEHEHEHADGEAEGYEERTTVATRTPRSIRPPSRSRRNTSNTSSYNPKSDDTVNSPSTASTLSNPRPITPYDDHLSDFAITSSVGRRLDKDKSLPPLPPSLKRSPTTFSNLRARTTSTGAGASPPLQHSTPASLGKASSSGMTTPRPLRLSQSNLLQPQKQYQTPSRQGDRPAVPVPSVSSSSFAAMASKRSVQLQLPSPLLLVPQSPSTPTLGSPVTPSFSSPVSGSASATPPGTPGGTLKPKPRTGTGMVYRNSTASRMRVPSALLRATSSPVAGGVPIAL